MKNKMKVVYGLLIATFNTVVAVGEENNISSKSKTSSALVKNKEEAKSKAFKTYGLGVSRISLGNNFHKAFSITSKRGRSINDIYKISFFRNNNFYKHLGEVHSLSNTGFGLDISPFKHKKIALGVGVGLGMNLQASKLFSDFRESFDFGFAYSLEAQYGMKKNWLLVSRYSKHDFNTNVLKLEDTKPEVVTLGLSYTF